MGKWLGSKKCDICRHDLSDYEWFADTIMKGHKWALLCEMCYPFYAAYPGKFGTGVGQKYSGRTMEKIEG